MADFFAPLETHPLYRAGMLAGAGHKIDSYKTDVAVKAGVLMTDVGAGYKDVKNFAAITDAPCGAVAYLSGKTPTLDGVNEFAAGEVINIVRKGQIYVISENALAVGGAIHVRVLSQTIGVGVIRNAQDGVNTFVLSGARVVKPSATINGVILTCIELNLP